MRKRGSWKRFASLLTMAVLMALCVGASLVVPARAEGDKTISGLGTAGIENPETADGARYILDRTVRPFCSMC